MAWLKGTKQKGIITEERPKETLGLDGAITLIPNQNFTSKRFEMAGYRRMLWVLDLDMLSAGNVYFGMKAWDSDGQDLNSPLPVTPLTEACLPIIPAVYAYGGGGGRVRFYFNFNLDFVGDSASNPQVKALAVGNNDNGSVFSTPPWVIYPFAQAAIYLQTDATSAAAIGNANSRFQVSLTR